MKTYTFLSIKKTPSTVNTDGVFAISGLAVPGPLSFDTAQVQAAEI
ncbi:hypothetical protein [Alkalicoccus chagannorensis]|nr:hypothetical protein [Alkalicoccus chagannorensis]